MKPGDRFTKLVIESIDGPSAVVRCDCGTRKTVRKYDLKVIKSCGCWKRQITIQRNKDTATRDGLTHTDTGKSWSAMMARCYNQRYHDYEDYGAKGIIACEAIRQSPKAIMDLIGERQPKTSLDRKDNTGSYTCGQCAECIAHGWLMNIRWATPKQQGRNQRTNRRVTIDGVTRCLADWADISGINYDSLRNRLDRGWPESRLLTPVL